MEEQTENTQTEQTEQTENQEVEVNEEDRFDKLRTNFAKEMSQMKSQLKEYQSKQAEIDTQKAREEEQRAIEKGEFDKVIESYRQQLTAKDDALKSFQAEVKTQKIDSELYRAGIKNEFSRIGALTAYDRLEEKPDVSSYISSLREQSPELFEDNKRHGKSSGTVGIPKNNGNESLAERLKSTDVKVARAAIKERLMIEMTGGTVDN